MRRNRNIEKKLRLFKRKTYSYSLVRFQIYQLLIYLKEMGIPDHLTCLLRNLYAGQEATVRTGHGTTDWFQIGKGVR